MNWHGLTVDKVGLLGCAVLLAGILMIAAYWGEDDE